MAGPQSWAPSAPLTGKGRWRRLLPFWLVGMIGLAVQWPTTGTALGPWLGGLGLSIVAVLSAAFLPWQRWSPAWQALPATAFYVVAVLLFTAETYDVALLLALMPVLWFTLYHGPRMQAAGIAGLAVALTTPLLLGRGTVGELWRVAIAAVLLGCLISVAGQQLVGRLRAATTALRTARNELEAENDFTSAVLNTADCLVIVQDRDAVITLFNRRCEEFTGLPAADVVGRRVNDVPLMSPEQQLRAREAMERMLVGEFPLRTESSWFDRTGHPRRIEWSNTALLGVDGRVTYIVGTGIDVAEHRRTTRLVQGVVTAATEQSIIAADLDGRINLFNVGAERMLGYSAAEAVGQLHTSALHVPAELQARATELGVPASVTVVVGDAAAGRAETREWTFVRKDGGHVPVCLTITGLRDDDGQLVGYVGVARDITTDRQAASKLIEALDRERLAGDRLREIDQIRQDFVATITHELRTPLTTIVGNLEIALDGDVGLLSAGQTKVLAAVDRNARRLYRLVDDLLLLSQIESGRLRCEFAHVVLTQVVERAVAAVDGQRAVRGIGMGVDVPADLTLFGDPAQLQRVLTNVLGNAIKFTPPGGAVSVRARRIDEFVELAVIDTGIGIPSDELPDVFGRFVRSSRSHSQETPGTGLGLAIGKWIVEQHGGAIWINSGEAAGTTVTMRLPISGSTTDRSSAVLERSTPVSSAE